MKYYLLALLVVVLSGCAGFAGWKNYDKTEFVKTSQGEAGAFAKMFTGNAKYCMLELHSIEGYVGVSAKYKDGSCAIKYVLQEGAKVEGEIPTTEE